MSTQGPETNRLPLSNQLSIWEKERNDHNIARINASLSQLEPSHRFIFSDPVLRMLLIPGAPVPDGWPQILPWVYEKRMSGSLLTWFVQQALGLKRLPFCEDRLLTKDPFENGQLGQIIKALTAKQVEATVRDVANLYEHTQTQLACKRLKDVSLRRSLRGSTVQSSYIEDETTGGVIARLKLAAYALGESTIQLDMDTLNSWGDDGGYEHYPVHIYGLIPAPDILYATELVEQPSRQELGEWVAINRSHNGVVNFSTADIVVPKLILNEETVKHNFAGESPQEFWDRYQPLRFRTGQSRFGCEQFNRQMPTGAGKSLWRRLFRC